MKKIETQKGRKIYPQRIGIVEPVFANIRVHKRMDKFNKGHDKSKYPVVAVLHGAQHRKDHQLCHGIRGGVQWANRSRG